MPVSRYYRGHGREVFAAMVREYGRRKGTRVFYATAQARHVAPPRKVRKRK